MAVLSIFSPMIQRRQFAKLMGITGLSYLSTGFTGPKLSSLRPQTKDAVTTLPGIRSSVFLEYGQQIHPDGSKFGFNNDYLAVFPTKSGYGLWVNHEYPIPKLQPFSGTQKEIIQKQKATIGGSYVEIQKKSGVWQPNVSKNNFQVTANSSITFAGNIKVKGSSNAKGTLANCSGGKTPWGNFLTCEENYSPFYGEGVHISKTKTIWKSHKKNKDYKWNQDPQSPAEHYGWVVEVNPKTKQAKKLTSLGRFAHEGATVAQTKDGRCVVYMGDDTINECIYKFVSSQKNSLEHGELFVADLENGKWLSLDLTKSKILQKHFANQLDVHTYTRKAAKLVGGTPTHRPEGIAVSPHDQSVLVALTNNTPAGVKHGLILKIEEKNHQHDADTFKSSTFLQGGKATGFSHPDNIVFDPNGNLWFTTDISGSDMKKKSYRDFGNNSLFIVPKNQLTPYRVAVAPNEAEFCSPCFIEDGKKMLLSVQHPGEKSKPNKYTSHWPHGSNSIPKPAVVLLEGPLLERLSHKKR